MAHFSPKPRSAKPLLRSPSTVVLITSDKQRVAVNSSSLTQSQMFSDMFSLPSDGSAEIKVAESKAVLDGFLPYCAQGKLAPFDLDDPLAWSLIKAFDKYDIGRGCDAVAAAIECARLQGLSRTYNSLAVGYFYAINFSPEDIGKIVGAIVEYDAAQLGEFMEQFVAFAEDEGLSDDGKLVQLFDKRKLLLFEARSTSLALLLAAKFDDHAWTAKLSYKSVGQLLKLWSKSSNCVSAAQLDDFLAENPASKFSHFDLLPWAELRNVLAALPTTLG